MMKPAVLSTLVYLENDDHVLMLHRIKKQEDINAGKWIGIGGKNLEGESFDACMKREVLEETGLNVCTYIAKGMLTFISDDYLEYIMVFTSDDFSGTLNAQCDEGILQWIDKSHIDALDLWEGDRYFLPKLFQSVPFFNMKLVYTNDRLIHVDCDGNTLFEADRS